MVPHNRSPGSLFDLAARIVESRRSFANSGVDIKPFEVKDLTFCALAPP